MTIDTENRVKRANPITSDEQLDQLFGVDTLDRFLLEVVAKKEGRMTETKPEQQPTPEKVDAQLTEAQPRKRFRPSFVLAAFIAVIAVGAVIMFTGDAESPVASNPPVEADNVTVYPKGPTVGDLPGTRWTVYAFIVDRQELRKLADTEIILQFSHDGVITGTGGCNDYQATYQQTGDYVFPAGQGFATDGVFIEFRGLTSTDNVCGSTALMEQEALYFESLRQTGRWWVVQDRELALGFTQGAQIVGARPAPNE